MTIVPSVFQNYSAYMYVRVCIHNNTICTYIRIYVHMCSKSHKQIFIQIHTYVCTCIRSYVRTQ